MTAEIWSEAGCSTHGLSSDKKILWAATAGYCSTISVGGKSSGKWYAEILTVGSVDANALIGFSNASQPTANYAGQSGTVSVGITSGGSSHGGNVGVVSPGAFNAGDTICVAGEGEKIWLRINNGAWANTGDPVAGSNPASTFPVSTEIHFCASPYLAGSETALAYKIVSESSDFAYTPPTGFSAWAGASPDLPTIKKPTTILLGFAQPSRMQSMLLGLKQQQSLYGGDFNRGY